MIPNTETTFNQEGERNRLSDLLSTYKRAQTRKDTGKILACEKASYVFEMGEELLKLKKSIAFGCFIKTIKSMGIARTSAEDFMRIVQRFGAYRDVVKNIDVSKLRVLAHRKNEHIKILMEGGTLSGVTIADISEMSIKEVRIFFQNKRLTKPMTWRRRFRTFKKHLKLAFSALAGGVK